MGVMDEVPPGGAGALPGTPQGLNLMKLMQTLFGAAQPTAGSPSGLQTTPGVIGGAPPALAGAPVGTGAPVGGNPGVPGQAPPISVPSPTREGPGPAPISKGPMEYGSKGGRDAAVVSSGIENLSQAIHGFKSKKDADELAIAQNTMKAYQQASQIDPQTGQPVDPYTKHLYENDPKIVRSWEKYLKFQFPREASDPGKKDAKGKPAQGAPHIPQPQADPEALLRQLMQQKMLAQGRAGQLAPSQGSAALPGTEVLSPEEFKDAMKEKYGLTPKMADAKASAKIDQEVATSKAEAARFKAEADKLNLEAAQLDPNNEYRRAQINAEIALANQRQSEADAKTREGNKSKSLQGFNVVKKGADEAYTDAAKQLTAEQKRIQNSRGKFSKAMGSDAEVTPEQEAIQNKLEMLNMFKTKLADMQDDVVNGVMSPTEARTKARRAANLTATLDPWNGVPQDAPQAPTKELPEGYAMKNSDGQDIAVKQGNKWVAP